MGYTLSNNKIKSESAVETFCLGSRKFQEETLRIFALCSYMSLITVQGEGKVGVGCCRGNLKVAEHSFQKPMPNSP